MKNLKHSVIAQILGNGKEYVQSRVDVYIDWYNTTFTDLNLLKGVTVRPLTETMIEDYRLTIQFALIKALGNYLLNTDVLKFNKFYWGAKGIEIQILIERDGKEYGLNTEVIIAHGDIQCRHYRYIVKTPLRKLGVDLTKRLTGIQKAEENVKYMTGVIKRNQDELNDVLYATFEEWLPKRSYHFREAGRNKEIKPTYEQIIAERPYMENLFQDEFARFQTIDNEKYIKGLIKRNQKDLDKYNAKLEAVIASN